MLESLVGGWTLVAAKFEFDDGTVEDMYGPNPLGAIVFTREGRMMTVLTRADRSTEQADPAILFRSMMSYTGRFELKGDELIIEVDAAWSPEWLGTQQRRFVKLDGDLYIRSPKQSHPLHPGRMLTGLLHWTRER